MIMKEENDCNHNVEGDAEEGTVDCVCRDQVVHKMKTGKAPGPSDVSFELTAAMGKYEYK